jgi:hypothetical protein
MEKMPPKQVLLGDIHAGVDFGGTAPARPMYGSYQRGIFRQPPKRHPQVIPKRDSDRKKDIVKKILEE